MGRRLLIFAGLCGAVIVGVLVWQRPTADGPHASTDALFVQQQREVRPVAHSPGDRSPRSADTTLLARATEAEVFGRFDRWAASYLAETDPEARRALMREGVEAATARRVALYDLIATDPSRALQRAVPWGVRQGLPPEIVALLENRVDGMGIYNALIADGVGGEMGFLTRRETVIHGTTYDTFVEGRRLELGSRSRLAVHGVAVDGRLAMMDSPVRVLDPGEPVPAGRRIEEVCSVSGLATAAGAASAPRQPIAADTGDRIVYLCSSGHIAVLTARLQEGEEDGENSSDGAASAAVAAAQGTKSVLMIRIRFADQPGWFEPESQASATAMFSAAEVFFSENSFGRLHIDGAISPVYTLPESAAWYTSTDSSGYGLNVLHAARAVAADPTSAPGNAGLPALDYLDFDLEVIRYTTGPGTFTGQAYVAMRGCWLKSPDPGVLIHELGHNLGLWHANAWNPTDALAPLGDGTNLEYGDAFDTMGPARGGAWHFNAWQKARLSWLPPESVAVIADGGLVKLSAHDLGGTVDAARRYAVKVRRDDDRDYWLEFRKHPDWAEQRPGVHQGIGVRWDPWLKSNGGSQLIDTTPGSPGGREDATLSLGRTFSDPAAGIHVTPVGLDPADPSVVDVEVRVGTFASNRRPLVSLSSDVVAAQPGQTVSLVAVASDPDGDPLSYSWRLDNSGDAHATGATVSTAWSESGDHRVRVTVSDRKGGTASASVVVRIGETQGARIAGRVIDLAGQPVAGVLVHNGADRDGDDYREAWSDSDGTFTILGLPAGTWQVDAIAPGWMFALEGFAPAVTTPEESGAVTILAHWKGFSVSGSVVREDGSPLAGAIVSDGTRSEPTDASGEFAINGLSSGRHELTITVAGAAFDPVSVEVGLSDETAVYLSEKTFTLSGEISGAGAAGAVVTNGWQSTTALTVPGTSSGAARYSLSGVPAGDWILRAVAPGASFSPAGFLSPVHVPGDVDGLAFTAESSTRLAISGRVLDRGFGLAGATVSTGGQSTVTDSRGAFWIQGLEAGSHEVAVAAPDMAFDPAARVVELSTGSVSGIDFFTTRVNEIPVVVSGPLVLGPTSRPFVTLAAEATDDDGAGLLRYWWSVADAAPGPVEFSANGALAARETVARFIEPGDYVVRVSVVDRHGAVRSTERTVSVRREFAAPVIVEAARADPAVVGTALETRLSVRAASDAGDARLVATWRVDTSSPGPVLFSSNNTPEARETVARFQAPGDYLLHVTVRDSAGQTAESSVAVHVQVTYGSWLSRHFDTAVIADPARRAEIWGELADPDGDGFGNLLEYAFGLDPLAPSTDGRPQTKFVVEDGIEYLAISFRPNPDAVDLIFEPQVSTDLETWQSGLVFMPGDDPLVLTYRDPLPASSHQRRFIRVNVSTQP